MKLIVTAKTSVFIETTKENKIKILTFVN